MGKELNVNKKAHHDYFVEDTIEAGIALQGWEVKSLVAKYSINIDGAFVRIKNGEAFLMGAHIAPLKTVNSNEVDKVDATRTRKLLLHKHEIFKLMGKVDEKGYSLIPLKIYINKKVKVLIGLCKGKKNFDKRQSEKEKDWKREQAVAMKQNKLNG